jgi:hypothetical protein
MFVYLDVIFLLFRYCHLKVICETLLLMVIDYYCILALEIWHMIVLLFSSSCLKFVIGLLFLSNKFREIKLSFVK